jgi:hypothetical protein
LCETQQAHVLLLLSLSKSVYRAGSKRMFVAGCLLASCVGGSFKPPDELVWLSAGIKLLEPYMCCEAYTGVMQVLGTRLRAVKTPFRI